MFKILLFTTILSTCFALVTKLGELNNKTFYLDDNGDCIKGISRDKCCFVGNVVLSINYTSGNNVRSVTYTGKQKDESCPQKLVNYPKRTDYTADTTVQECQFGDYYNEKYATILNVGTMAGFDKNKCEYQTGFTVAETSNQIFVLQKLLYTETVDNCKKLVQKPDQDNTNATGVDTSIPSEKSNQKEKSSSPESSSSSFYGKNIIFLISFSMLFQFVL